MKQYRNDGKSVFSSFLGFLLVLFFKKPCCPEEIRNSCRRRECDANRKAQAFVQISQNSKNLQLRPHLYGLGYLRQPFPETIFPTFI